MFMRQMTLNHCCFTSTATQSFFPKMLLWLQGGDTTNHLTVETPRMHYNVICVGPVQPKNRETYNRLKQSHKKSKKINISADLALRQAIVCRPMTKANEIDDNTQRSANCPEQCLAFRFAKTEPTLTSLFATSRSHSE